MYVRCLLPCAYDCRFASQAHIGKGEGGNCGTGGKEGEEGGGVFLTRRIRERLISAAAHLVPQPNCCSFWVFFHFGGQAGLPSHGLVAPICLKKMNNQKSGKARHCVNALACKQASNWKAKSIFQC